MISSFLAVALVQSAPDGAPAAAPTPPVITMELVDLPIEQQSALRCAVAIALATERQRSDPAANADWPDLQANNRGREFFVRTFARLLDDTGIAREGLALRGREEAQELVAAPQDFAAIMPPCLLMLEASGL